MAYPVWPASLPDPEVPLNARRPLPLRADSSSALGRFTTARKMTRPIIQARAMLLLDAADYQTLADFWRDTLFNGKALFTAPWLALCGYPDYAVKLLEYKTGTRGILPSITLIFEFLPVTVTPPDPWPAP